MSLTCLSLEFMTIFALSGGHDQSQPGSHQTLDHPASYRDPGVRGRCRHRVHFQPVGREGNTSVYFAPTVSV